MTTGARNRRTNLQKLKRTKAALESRRLRNGTSKKAKTFTGEINNVRVTKGYARYPTRRSIWYRMRMAVRRATNWVKRIFGRPLVEHEDHNWRKPTAPFPEIE